VALARCFSVGIVAKVCKQGQIGVCGLARFAPTLERESADEAKLPTLRLANSLQLSGRLDDFIRPLPS
jgi:hypothetical protein